MQSKKRKSFVEWMLLLDSETPIKFDICLKIIFNPLDEKLENFQNFIEPQFKKGKCSPCENSL
jgi:hypothetical protein